ncbi:unnamed protein product [Vitrella brassicaformis CCMP3155]|uniref:Molybdate-anion transporter n=4 Tax=Vitrella brassicaformis TaxID=1169539 RepID=A0A0G4EWH1_VITBC|nr:unnamed protein product [Vitrella brassicaformis CCMP3155]|mmetsp:Transcript_12784/g.37121  ORF Transcript_12784/g.37121 Transcript_12784/m.37121 type:complete len:510 (-) Transcript_12784:2901-4430(-)|eukprot:CEM02696.1 unnamed protein product [Vitrella brassicaformis CCMP3155]
MAFDLSNQLQKSETAAFLTLCGVVLVICAIKWLSRLCSGAPGVHADSRKDDVLQGQGREGFKRFQLAFIAAYLAGMFSDWVQGPYLYRVYEAKNLPHGMESISHLYVSGYSAMAAASLIVAPLADHFGRRATCVLFCVLYSASCLLMLLDNFWLLLVGRLLSGMSVMILYNVFEAWMATEHLNRAYAPALLMQTYVHMTAGNSLNAIVASLAAWGAVHTTGDILAPFYLGILALVVSGCIICFSWGENHGRDEDSYELHHFWEMVRNALMVPLTDTRVACVGVIQTCFDSALYVFIFLWTPSLPPDTEVGILFAAMMVAVGIGGHISSLFEHADGDTAHADEHRAVITVPTCIYNTVLVCAYLLAGFASSKASRLAAILLQELCAGMHYTSFFNLRALTLPQQGRLTIQKLFHFPATVVTVAVLLTVKEHHLQEAKIRKMYFTLAGVAAVGMVSSAVLVALDIGTITSQVRQAVRRVRKVMRHGGLAADEAAEPLMSPDERHASAPRDQ